jgi:hypothetical protein
MKINTYGEVIITPDAIKIEGWNISREAADPADATEEQLLLAFAVNWALARLKVEIKNASIAVFQAMQKQLRGMN